MDAFFRIRKDGSKSLIYASGYQQNATTQWITGSHVLATHPIAVDDGSTLGALQAYYGTTGMDAYGRVLMNNENGLEGHLTLVDVDGDFDFGASCAADLNADGGVDTRDWQVFMSAYAAGNISVADFNHDGHVSIQDLFDYQTAYFGGCH